MNTTDNFSHTIPNHSILFSLANLMLTCLFLKISFAIQIISHYQLYFHFNLLSQVTSPNYISVPSLTQLLCLPYPYFENLWISSLFQPVICVSIMEQISFVSNFFDSRSKWSRASFHEVCRESHFY